MLFDTFHIIYIIVSAVLTVIFLFVLKKSCKTEQSQILALRIIACTVVLIHYSELWVNFLSTGEARVEGAMLFPIYPCNVMMWLLLLTSFLKKRNNIWMRILTEFVAIAGVVCGVAGIVLNFNYDACGLNSYGIFSGLFSHSVMVLGCLLLFVTHNVKIRVFNVISAFAGLVLFLVDGLIINGIYAVAGLAPVNSMFLLEPAFANLPWAKFFAIAAIALAAIFVITSIVELVALKKEDRWYSKLKKIFFRNKHVENNSESKSE